MLNHQSKWALLALAVSLTLPGSAVAVEAVSQADEQSPRLIAIKLHADWCGGCRKMGPVFEDLSTVMEDAPVLFVRLDLTDGASRTQSAYLMKMMGLGEVWRHYDSGKKTGVIAIVDAAAKKPVAVLKADQDLKQMKADLSEALQTSQG